MGTENPAQARDRLLDAVVADGDVLPPGLEQIVLGDDLAGSHHEEAQHIELPVGDRDRLPGSGQATLIGVELEGFEDIARTSWHGAIVSTSSAFRTFQRFVQDAELAGAYPQTQGLLEDCNERRTR